MFNFITFYKIGKEFSKKIVVTDGRCSGQCPFLSVENQLWFCEFSKEHIIEDDTEQRTKICKSIRVKNRG